MNEQASGGGQPEEAGITIESAFIALNLLLFVMIFALPLGPVRAIIFCVLVVFNLVLSVVYPGIYKRTLGRTFGDDGVPPPPPPKPMGDNVKAPRLEPIDLAIAWLARFTAVVCGFVCAMPLGAYGFALHRGPPRSRIGQRLAAGVTWLARPIEPCSRLVRQHPVCDWLNPMSERPASGKTVVGVDRTSHCGDSVRSFLGFRPDDRLHAERLVCPARAGTLAVA
jgi:hypothetical protein